MFVVGDGAVRAMAYPRQVDSVLRSTLPTMTLDESYAAKEKMVEEILPAVAWMSGFLSFPRWHYGSQNGEVGVPPWFPSRISWLRLTL